MKKKILCLFVSLVLVLSVSGIATAVVPDGYIIPNMEFSGMRFTLYPAPLQRGMALQQERFLVQGYEVANGTRLYIEIIGEPNTGYEYYGWSMVRTGASVWRDALSIMQTGVRWLPDELSHEDWNFSTSIGWTNETGWTLSQWGDLNDSWHDIVTTLEVGTILSGELPGIPDHTVLPGLSFPAWGDLPARYYPHPGFSNFVWLSVGYYSLQEDEYGNIINDLGGLPEFRLFDEGTHMWPIDTMAQPTISNVLVNNVAVDFQAYNINGYNFFKLRDIAYVLNGTAAQFNVEWVMRGSEEWGMWGEIHIDPRVPYQPIGGELVNTSVGAAAASFAGSPIEIYRELEDWRGEMTWQTRSPENPLVAYNINGYNYFRLRDLGDALGFSVDWDESANTILITTN